MKRIRFFAAIAAAVTLLVGAVAPWSQSAAHGQTGGTGPTISLGTPTFDGTVVRVPILLSGSGFDAYVGVQATLLWDPAVFSYAGYDATGSVIPNAFCGEAADSSTTGPHNGVSDGEQVGCLPAPRTSLTSVGLMTTFKLTPISGCSALHLLTFSAPDNDPEGSASKDAQGNPQVNTYGTIDATVDVNGVAGCSAGAAATATPTITVAAGATSTPTATGTPKTLLTVTPTTTPSATPTAGASPAPSGSTPSAGQVTAPAAGAAPGTVSEAAGTVRVPKSGSGDAAARTTLDGLIAMAAAGVIGLSATGYAWRRRPHRA